MICLIKISTSIKYHFQIVIFFSVSKMCLCVCVYVSISVSLNREKKSDANWLTCIIWFISIELYPHHTHTQICILETITFDDWDSDLYLQAIITTISITPLPDIHCKWYTQYMLLWGEKLPNVLCVCAPQPTTFTLLIISRIQMDKSKPHRRIAQLPLFCFVLFSLFFLPFVGVTGNVQYFFCCRRCW